MSDKVPLKRITFVIREDEMDAIDLLAHLTVGKYQNNRSAAARYLLRCGMDAEGIGVLEREEFDD